MFEETGGSRVFRGVIRCARRWALSGTCGLAYIVGQGKINPFSGGEPLLWPPRVPPPGRPRTTRSGPPCSRECRPVPRTGGVPSPVRRTRRSSRTARHEAGHAVVALALGMTVDYVRVGPDGVGGGCYVSYLASFRDEEVAAMYMAGVLSELRASGPVRRRCVRGAREDVVAVLRLGRACPRGGRAAWWARAEALALRVLRENWACVLRVAAELEVRDLGGDEVRAMARRSSPSRRT